MRTPVPARKDSTDDDFFCSLIESKIGVPSEEKEVKPKKQKILDNPDSLEEELDFLSSDVYYYLYQDESQEGDKGVIM